MRSLERSLAKAQRNQFEPGTLASFCRETYKSLIHQDRMAYPGSRIDCRATPLGASESYVRRGSSEFGITRPARCGLGWQTEPGWSAGRASPVEKLNGKFPEGSQFGLWRPKLPEFELRRCESFRAGKIVSLISD